MRHPLLAARLCCLGLCALGPSPAAAAAAAVPRLPYAPGAFLDPDAPQPQQAQFGLTTDASTGQPADSAATAEQSLRSGSYLSIDLGAAYDSNFTNQTGLAAVDVLYDGEAYPIELDPAYRSRAGIGESVGMSAGLRLPLSDTVSAAVDADVQYANYPGQIGDDLNLLLAAGPEVTINKNSQAAVQAVASERVYGGVVASRSIGLRGRYQQPLGGGRLYLFVDGRVFESGYGDIYGGTQASVFLTYEELVDPSVSLSFTAYGRREWIEADEYSNLDFGIYGGPSAFLPLGLKGGFTVGISRTAFDDPLLFYSPHPRRDWRYSGYLWLMPKKPVGPGLWPSISYTYTRTDSSLQFYRTDRHRVRLGVAKYW